MKYILIAILTVSTTAQGASKAKPFSMSDYAAKTGKIPAKKVVKNTISFSEKLANTARSIEKARAKVDSLTARKTEVYRQHSEAMAKIGTLTGDTTRAVKMADMDRKSRLFTIDAEIKKAYLKIASLTKHLTYYEHMVKGEKMAKELGIGKLVSFSC